MNVVDEHLSAVLLEWIAQYGGGEKFGFTPKTAASALLAQYGIEASQLRMASVMDGLVEFGCGNKTYSPLTNGHYSIDKSKAHTIFSDEWVGDAMNRGTSDPTDTDLARKYPALNAYVLTGTSWINFVVAELQNKSIITSEFPDDLDPIAVPAAGRIVTLKDNQCSEINEIVGNLIDSISVENAITGDVPLKDRFVGQLRAGRELIESKVIEIHLLYQTFMGMLAQLIEKYRGHVIGETAKQLWGLLLKHIFGGN